jgi:quercetin dioxygenase-like cupin family protein
MGAQDQGKLNIDDCIVRFADLASQESPYHPLDMQLPRYDRKRYSVIGRPSEQAGAVANGRQVKEFSVVYIKCEPGKGIGAHGHATSEVFIVMSGRWKLTGCAAGEHEVELGPWDVISVPPDLMHGAVNVSDEDGWLMAINAGQAGAKITWAPELLAELRALGGKAAETEAPGLR